MINEETNSVEQLENILQELEALAPTRDEVRGTEITYRLLEDYAPINDTIDELSREEIESSEAEAVADEPTEVPEPQEFLTVRSGAVAAVDSGIARLGETRNGLVIALRAANVIDAYNASSLNLFRTGAFYLLNRSQAQVLHKIGSHLLKPDLFVEIDNSDPEKPRLGRVKTGIADNAHKFGDRFRNWLERLVQRTAVSSIEHGVILFDGALTYRTYDTPQIFLERLAEEANDHDNAVIAISKQSMLNVAGKPIQFWLDDAPNKACYRWLTSLMRQENRERFMGNVYAARFSALGPTFRMDVKSVEGQSDDEAINQFYSSVLMRCGYPDILVRTHAYSYFTPPDVVQLQAQAGAKYSFRPSPEPNLTGIFAPFGGRFK